MKNKMRSYHITIKPDAPAFSDYEMQDIANEFIATNKTKIETSSTFFVNVMRARLLTEYNYFGKEYRIVASYYDKFGKYVGKEIIQDFKKPSFDYIPAKGSSVTDLENVQSLMDDTLFRILDEKSKLTKN